MMVHLSRRNLRDLLNFDRGRQWPSKRLGVDVVDLQDQFHADGRPAVGRVREPSGHDQVGLPGQTWPRGQEPLRGNCGGRGR